MQFSRKSITKKTIIIWSLIVLGVVGIWMRLHLSNPKEPSYQGKSLSEWLNESDEVRAREALAEMGTNAIPFLLKSIADKDSPLKKKLLKLAGKQSVINFNIYSAQAKQLEAMAGFELLGAKAAPAIPALEKLFENGETTIAAGMSLAVIGNESVPILVRGLTYTNWHVRHSAAAALGYLEADAKIAVPNLLDASNDTNRMVRSAAVWALGEIKEEPILVIPALIKRLDDKDTTVRWNAALALGEFGNLSSNAVPKLTKIAEAKIPYLSEHAVTALEKIDPEAAKIFSK